MIKNLTTFAILLFAQIVFAQEATIVVEADRITSQEIETARSAVVLNEAAIRAKRPATVADLLRDIPGLEVVRSGHLGQVTSVFIRGSDAAATLVLIDGIEANDVISPGRGYNFSNLPPTNIARIEVYRGPQSVRFGSGALGGVIHIITKEGIGSSGLDYYLEGGSYDSRRLALGFNGRKDAFAYSLSAEGFATDGFSSASASSGHFEDDGTETQSYSTKLAYHLSKVSKLETTLRYLKSESDLDRGGGASADDPNYESSADQFLAGLSGETRFVDNVLSTLGFYYSESTRQSLNEKDAAAPQDYLKDKFEGQYLKAETSHEIAIEDEHKIRLDLQWRQEKADSNSYGEDAFGGPYVDELDSETQEIFGEGVTYIYESDQLFADAGLRADQPSRSDDVLSGRISLGSFLSQDKTSKIYLTFGTGFKAPSLYQLYSQLYGNRDLEQEDSQTTELTVQAGGSSAVVTLTVFENKYRDLIDFNNSQYYNVDKAKSRGLELNSDFKVSAAVAMKASFAYLDSVDEVTGLQLLRRPRRSYGLEGDFKLGALTSSVKYHFRGYRPDSDPVTFDRMTSGSYGLVDLSFEYKLQDDMALKFRAENIFDKKYEEVAGYGSAERSFYAGLTGRL